MYFNKLFQSQLLFDAGSGGGTGDAGQGDQTVTMKQSALDALFGQRADQASRSAVANLLKDLGVQDIEALKANLKAADDLKKAQEESERAKLDEVARIKADLTKATDRNAQMEADLQKLRDSQILAACQSEVERFAREAGFAKAEDAWSLIDRSKVTFSEGKVVGAKEQVTKLATDKPYLLEAKKVTFTPRTPRSRGSQSGSGSAPMRVQI